MTKKGGNLSHTYTNNDILELSMCSVVFRMVFILKILFNALFFALLRISFHFSIEFGNRNYFFAFIKSILKRFYRTDGMCQTGISNKKIFRYGETAHNDIDLQFLHAMINGLVLKSRWWCKSVKSTRINTRVFVSYVLLISQMKFTRASAL